MRIGAAVVASRSRMIWVMALVFSACGEPSGESDPVVEAASRPRLQPLLDSLRADPGELGDDRVAIEDASGHALGTFYAALRRAEAGEGRAVIAVYGGSHTAGDLYTGRMREIFQARFGDLGHGFVPLVPVINAHWAWGMVIDEAEGFEVMQVSFKRREVSRYGLAGVSFLADEADAFAAVSADHWGNARAASRVELLYDRLPGGGHLEVWLDGAQVDVLDTSAEAPRSAVRTYRTSDNGHRLEVRAVGDGPVTVFGVVEDRPRRPGVLVHNLGLVGSKARHHLLWDEASWAYFFRRLEADLVVLAYGNNETTDTHLSVADHERQLREVLARIRRAAPDASCLLVGPTDRPRERNDGTLEARPIVLDLTEMQRRVASDLECGFFDTLAFQGGLGAGIRWLAHDPPYLREDRQHLTRYGYRRWGEALSRGILTPYRSSP